MSMILLPSDPWEGRWRRRYRSQVNVFLQW